MRIGRGAVVALLVASSGCIDESRVNDTCRWTDVVNRPLDLRSRADREHLRADAEIANELVVRIGDSHAPHRPDLQAPYRDRCIASLVDSITARHAVSREDFATAERARVWWADVLIVFLPVALLAVVALDGLTRRIRQSYDAEDWVVAAILIAVLVPIGAAVSLGVANFWAFAVEGIRLRNGHVSNRAFLIPIAQHPWISYAVSLALSAIVATYRSLRTPAGSSSRSFVPSFARTARR